MNLGSCDTYGKVLEIADCIQEKDGTFFCSKVCAEKHQPAEPDNQLEIYYDN